MSKRFITLKDVEQQISNGKIYLEEKTLLSSALKDYIKDNNIEVVYGKETCVEKPTVAECACLATEVIPSDDFTETAKLIEKILRNDFAVQDEDKINKIIKIIREVLK